MISGEEGQTSKQEEVVNMGNGEFEIFLLEFVNKTLLVKLHIFFFFFVMHTIKLTPAYFLEKKKRKKAE